MAKPKVTVIDRTNNSPPTTQANRSQAFRRTTTQAIAAPPIYQPPIIKHVAVSQTVQRIAKHNIHVKREFNPQAIRRPVPTVTHVTTDLTTDQVNRIKKIQGSGRGKYFIIMGNGPSLSQIDTQALSEHKSLQLCTINVPDYRCWPTPYWAFYDLSQYNRHKELFKIFQGTIFNSTGIKEPHANNIKFRNISGLGYSKDASKGIYVGMSSVFATIQIAMYMGFERIYITGCDMNASVNQTQTHFYGVNPDVPTSERMKRFQKEANWYDKMADILSSSERDRIVFCSKGVNKWPFVNKFDQIEPGAATEYIIRNSNNAS